MSNLTSLNFLMHCCRNLRDKFPVIRIEDWVMHFTMSCGFAFKHMQHLHVLLAAGIERSCISGGCQENKTHFTRVWLTSTLSLTCCFPSSCREQRLA